MTVTSQLIPSEPAIFAAHEVLRLGARRESLTSALDTIAATLHADSARLWWRVRPDFPLQHWATVGAEPPSGDHGPDVPGVWEPIWTDESLMIDAATSDLPDGAAAIQEGFSDAWALIPSGSRARGAVVLTWREPGERVSDTDRELLRVSLSAFTAQLWWRERWAQRKLERELLDETGRLLAKAFERDEVLGQIFELLGRVVRYEAGGIFLIHSEQGDLEHLTQVGYKVEKLDHVHLKIGQGLVGHVATTGETVNVRDVREDPRYVNARDATRSALVVPVDVRGKLLGVLNLESDRLGAYDPNDEWLVRAFAQQVAIALDRAELFKKEVQVQRLSEQLSVARSIQQSFLPQRMPDIPGYDIHGVNYPSEQVGGDYFDFVPIVEGQWGVAIADVSGKGIPAALIMAGFRASLIAEIRNNYAIRTILRKVNNVLLEMTPRDNFVTAFYGVLDARNHVFTFSNGGHNPPLLLRQDGEVERLKEGGPLVGVIADARYEERPIWLTPGDVLLLYTDGVTEASGADGEEFGEARLIELIGALRDQSAADICNRIHEAVRGFADRRAAVDDITMIAIKVLGA